MYNQKPHDTFFKETFAKGDVAKSFIEHYLPKEILDAVDIQSLEPQKDSFVREDLSEVFSDLLFRTTIANKRGYFYFLFEHKSYQSRQVALQLLSYMVEIWKSYKEKESQLPLIIPMVIAHGRSNWNTSMQFADLVQEYDELEVNLQKYVPNYQYILFDLSCYSNEEIKGNVQLRILMEVFRDIFKVNTAQFMNTLERSVLALQELEDRETRTAYFQTLIHYIFNVRKDLTKSEVNEFSERIEQTFPEGSVIIMSLREEFIKEGRQEGRQEGRHLQSQEDIHHFLEDRIGEEARNFYEVVSSIDDLERLIQLKRKLNRAQSTAEIKKLIMEVSD